MGAAGYWVYTRRRRAVATAKTPDQVFEVEASEDDDGGGVAGRRGWGGAWAVAAGSFLSAELVGVGMSSDEVPEERCGFVLEPEDVPVHWLPDRYEARSHEWYRWSDAVCCWRKVWDDADDGRCIWHAETDDKPAEELVAARAHWPERLDGAYVPAVELGNATDFEDCGLQAATFDGTELREASFAEADGRFAQFPDANLRFAQFPHADLTVARFPDAALREAQFPAAALREAQFPAADLTVARFPDANLYRAQFPDAVLRYAQFPDANLSAADLSDTAARRARFIRADLEAATLTNADLGDADLTDARLHDAHMLDVRINDGTRFGSVVPEEADVGWFDSPLYAVGARLRWWRRLLGMDAEDRLDRYDQLERARTIYRTLQRLYRENSMPRRIDHYYVRARDTRRKQAILARQPLRWLYLAAQRWVMGYGERPMRVVATSLAVVGLAALLYPLWGLSVGKAHEPTARAIGYPFETVGLLAGLGKSVYFSVITFTTLGYGDVQPLGFGEALATAESLVGAFLMALLVYVLGRRATR